MERKVCKASYSMPLRTHENGHHLAVPSRTHSDSIGPRPIVTIPLPSLSASVDAISHPTQPHFRSQHPLWPRACRKLFKTLKTSCARRPSRTYSMALPCRAHLALSQSVHRNDKPKLMGVERHRIRTLVHKCTVVSHVTIREVLHGTSLPEAHFNGFQTKKK